MVMGEAVSKIIISDDMEIHGLLKAILKTKERLWIWQKKRGDGTRPVHYATIKRVDQIKKTVVIQPNNTTGFRFDPKEPVFIYSQDRFIAFKVPVREYDKFYISFSLPGRINHLDSEWINGLELVEREDENSNLHKRAQQRVSAQNDQIVSVRKISGTDVASRPQFYMLYDMSKGGMGFKMDDPAEFVPGDRIEVLGIDGKELPKKLRGTVKAVRQMDDLLKSFKVGVQFDQ